MSSGAAPKGWYPQDDGDRRYWDGKRWTDDYYPLRPKPPVIKEPEKPAGLGETIFMVIVMVAAGLFVIFLSVMIIKDGQILGGIILLLLGLSAAVTTPIVLIICRPDGTDTGGGGSDLGMAGGELILVLLVLTSPYVLVRYLMDRHKNTSEKNNPLNKK